MYSCIRGYQRFISPALPAAFKLEAPQTTTPGVVIATYRRAGEIRTGSYQHAEPSEAELERRGKLA